MTTVDGKQKHRYFATLKEAVEAKEAKDSAKLAPKIAKRAALKEKRARDLLMRGNNSKQERDVAIEMQTCVDAAYGPGTVLVMNDGTRADLLFKRDGGYLQLQLKTTKTTKKGTNGYQFKDVLGYAGMLVVCWVVDLQKAWVFDGTWLHARGKKNYILTPDCPSETAALKTNLSMTELLTYLHDVTPAAHVRLTTEDAARNDFQGLEQKKEKIGIDAYEVLKPADYQWPRGQNGEYDRARIDDGRVVRIQHKSCAPNGNKAGFYCPNLGKSDGKDDDGKRMYRCYDKDDADLIVFHYDDASTKTSHFWEIPSEVLAQHGYFTNTLGKETITLYGPVGKQPDPNARCQADTWTRAFYAGALKHT